MGKNFLIQFDTNERGLPTLFKYQYFTIDAKEREDWDYSQLDDYLGEYKLSISPAVKQKYHANTYLEEILSDLEKADASFVISRNNSTRYEGKKQYIKCRIPVYVLKSFKKIFISTLVYNSSEQKTPTSEYMKFLFDIDAKTVELTELVLFEPVDNPFYRYARNAVESLSVEAIGLSQYTIESEKSVKDFYDRNQMTAWKTRDKLEKESEIANQAGIYMLYNQELNTFYVGKAIHLKERILQHTKKADDPMPNFTHYRYSVISGEYYEFLYLIENAAIHDLAWLLNMPAAKKYTPSLAKKVNVDLHSCRMVNVVEHQTRKQ